MAALDAEADPGVALALSVFPGAQILRAVQPACWPPDGGWIPSSGRRIDPYAPAMPTAQCPVCGALAWHRAGAGLTCDGGCHPPPGGGHATVTDAELDATLFGLAERARFPRLALSPGVTVQAGKEAGRDSQCSPRARRSARPPLRL